MTVERRSVLAQRCVRFTAPPEVAGSSEYESSRLRVRLAEILPRDKDTNPPVWLLARVEVENRLDQLAHIRADRSCLIDPDLGAKNLFLTARILPAESWVEIDGAWPSFITLSITFPGVMYADRTAENSPPIGATQRLLLMVEWEDGQSETVDLSYEVVPAEPGDDD